MVNYRVQVLYLNPVFKYSQKLIKNHPPIPNRLIPLFLNLSNREINRLFEGIIIGERKFVFSVFSYLSIEILNQISGVNDFSYFNRKIIE